MKELTDSIGPQIIRLAALSLKLNEMALRFTRTDAPVGRTLMGLATDATDIADKITDATIAEGLRRKASEEQMFEKRVLENLHPKRRTDSGCSPGKYEAVAFRPANGSEYELLEWRAIVKGVLQRPTFNSKGAALAFASAVFEGTRAGEPV